MTVIKSPLAVSATFLWIGFVCAISFMEAWLKFRAPGITVSLGLGIGRLVFDALNKVEWAFVIAIAISILLNRKPFSIKKHITFFIPAIVLIAQTIWLLPVLDARAELHIQAKTVSPSNLHLYYIAVEFVKIVCLIIYGLSLFTPTEKTSTNTTE